MSTLTQDAPDEVESIIAGSMHNTRKNELYIQYAQALRRNDDQKIESLFKQRLDDLLNHLGSDNLNARKANSNRIPLPPPFYEIREEVKSMMEDMGAYGEQLLMEYPQNIRDAVIAAKTA